MQYADVLIVGGGPAGSAAAKGLTDRGYKTVILERAVHPRGKPCAGWITPETLHLLELLFGQQPPGLTAYRKFHFSVKQAGFTLPTRQFAVRRAEFDHWMISRCGAEVIHHRVKSVVPVSGGYMADDAYFGRYLIGAGGTGCPVYRCLFSPEHPRDRSSLIAAMEQEFPYPHEGRTCRIWYLQDGLPGYSWFIPKAEGIVNVGVGGKTASLRARGDRLQRHWQLLTKRLEETGLVRDYQYAPAARTYYLRQNRLQLQLGQAYLTGDAAGVATRDMGEGIGPAVHSGMLAADAIAESRDYLIEPIRRYSFPSIALSRLYR